MPTVTVTVSATGRITCTPDPVPVSGADQTISFVLETSTYRFPTANAVVVKTAPNSQFPQPAQTEATQLVTLFDANTDALTYDYTVRVVRKSDNAELELDPSIENGK
ncbi:hypothetical protein [Ideonella sp.]|uniref:hypothetical protein n=1 Tax=Ideonella sp. TaxID=1929293 RepID=UPI0035AFA56E